MLYISSMNVNTPKQYTGGPKSIIYEISDEFLLVLDLLYVYKPALS